MRFLHDFVLTLDSIFGEKGAEFVFVVLCFLLLFLVFLIVRSIKRLALYKHANCSICEMPTGFGNKCFQLVDGCMCQVCADKLLANTQIVKKAGPKFFTKPPHNFSVAEVRGAVAHYNEVGRDRVLREQAAFREQRRQEGVTCSMCGGHSISATSGDFGSDVWITCLNCGHQWRPGQHRSW